MALTKVSSKTIQTGVVGPKIANVQIANSAWSVLDDTAVDTAGGYIIINGSNFTSGCEVSIDGTAATSVSRVSDTVLRAQVPAKSAGSYTVYVVNTDGGTALRINGLTYSGFPSWVTGSTLTNQQKDIAISIQLSATGATSYSLQAGSSLPAGTTLASNGLFSGTVTGITSETTYSFTVEATDAENQNSPRTFSVTVTVAPVQKLYVMGAGNNGVLGLNDTVSRSSPVQVGSDTTWSKITGGFYHTLALKSDGTLWSWGQNNNGQLGLGDVILRSSPVQVGILTDWYDIACGRLHSMATRTNNTLWVFGDNSNDQLGFDATGTRRSSPTQVSGTSWSLVAAAAYRSFATRTNGSIWGWGNNAQGQLGLSDALSKVSPTQIGTNTNWSKLRAWYNGTFGIKTDGTLWAWGFNNGGQLGLNDIVHRSSPVQVGTNTNWSDIRGGEGQAIGLKTDGTLWTIGGFNGSGELGQNDTVRRSSPTQIGSGTNWSKISAGYNEYGAVKTDKTLWLWGLGSYGQLGQGDRTNKSSPVQVGNMTTWTDLGHSYFVTYGISE